MIMEDYGRFNLHFVEFSELHLGFIRKFILLLVQACEV